MDSIYTKNTKYVFPIIQSPSPPGRKDPPITTTANVKTNAIITTTAFATRSTSDKNNFAEKKRNTNGAKRNAHTARRAVTAANVCNLKRKFNGLDAFAPEISRMEKQTKNEVIKLQRNSCGMFEITQCGNCSSNTQHRCTFPILFGKYLDVDSDKRICGEPICNLCLGETNKKNRCLYHRQKDEVRDI